MPPLWDETAGDERIVGIVLAGGGAVRLGGGDKTLRMLGDRPVLAHILERLRPQCAQIALNANGDPRRFEAFGLPVVPDHPEDDGGGPLAGLLASLDHVAARWADATAVLTVPGDAPFLPVDLAARLGAASRAAEADVVCARSGGRTHGLTALWRLSLRHQLRRALRHDGVHRVGAFLAGIKLCEVDWDSAPVDPFFNVNTPADLVEAARLLFRR